MKWLLTALLCATSSISICAAASPRTALSGQVLDSNGKPLAHATVLVYHAGVKVGYSTYCPSCYRDCGKRVTTNKHGNFKVNGLAPDLWFTLLAVHEDDIPTISERLDPDKKSGLKIVLAPRSAKSENSSIALGQVKDSAGNPVPDAIVQPIGLILGQSSVYGRVNGLDPISVTNAQGDFELSYNGASPAMLVEIEGRGYAPKIAKITTGSDRTPLVVSQGAAIRGILIANGKPLRNAEVGLIAKDRGGYANKLTIIGHPYEEQRVGTAADGSFLISNVPEPVTWLLYGKMSSMPNGKGTVPIEVSTTGEGQYLNKVRLEAEAAHVVTGRVTLSDGHPIPEGMRLMLMAEHIWDSDTVMLNKDGSFAIQNVPDGDFCISPSVKGYETRNMSKNNCDVPIKIAGQDQRDFHLVLYPVTSRR